MHRRLGRKYLGNVDKISKRPAIMRFKIENLKNYVQSYRISIKSLANIDFESFNITMCPFKTVLASYLQSIQPAQGFPSQGTGLKKNNRKF